LQGLDAHVQRHLDLLAEHVFGGCHPEQWLWRSHKQFILDRLLPGERVLDVGCGVGAYLVWMAEKGCRVTACDVDPVRIAQARALSAHANLTFEVRDVLADPPQQTFDVVVCSHVLEHLDDPVGLLATLQHNAPRLIVAVPSDDSCWQKVMFRHLGLPWKDDEDHRREYSPALLQDHLRRGGWRTIEMHAGIDLKAVAVRGEPAPAAP
jgi:SAM-dependent methyltransferase